MPMDFWTIVGVLIATFILTNVLVTVVQRWRLQRIERKSQALCSESADTARRLPITLLTGFLGSGKTSLVNRILASADHGLRIVVIENELGAVSIDHKLIDTARQQHMPEGVVVLKNGCMCCSGEAPGYELERVLDKLIEMDRLEGGVLPFDCVLIETTGLADPTPILQVLCRREMQGSHYYLDAVITLVDCQNVMRHLRPSGPFAFARRRAEVERQLALADRILLNKMDLVSDSEAAEVTAAVRTVNASAALLYARHADVPPQQLLGLNAFSSSEWLSHLNNMEVDRGHSSTVSCVSLQAATLDFGRLQVWLQALTAERSEDLYRMKGVLSISGHEDRFVLHGIHSQVEGHFERPWAPDEPRSSALVIIGHRLNRRALEEGLHSAIASQDAAAECAAKSVTEYTTELEPKKTR